MAGLLTLVRVGKFFQVLIREFDDLTTKLAYTTVDFYRDGRRDPEFPT